MKMNVGNLGRAALLACVLAVPTIQGCATNTDDPRVVAAVEDKPFSAWFDSLVKQVEADPNYKRMPIDTEAEANQFMVQLHDAYRHRIAKKDFAALLNSRYPNHQNEVSFIVSRLP